MTHSTFLSILLLAFLSLLGTGGTHAEETADTKIEALIKHVASLNDAKFVRNGSEYDAANAAKFLREKWKAHKADVKTPADFVEKIATKSSTTGKPYLIRFKDGKEVSCGEYLKGKLGS